MITKFKKIGSLIFDGREPEMLGKIFDLNAEIYISASIKLEDFAANNFEGLPGVTGIKNFDFIVKTGGFVTDGGFLNLYRGSYNLRLYYYKKDNAIIVLAYGEFQPGRYMLCIEGVWVIDRME
jgi:hypothetical protein